MPTCRLPVCLKENFKKHVFIIYSSKMQREVKPSFQINEFRDLLKTR